MTDIMQYPYKVAKWLNGFEKICGFFATYKEAENEAKARIALANPGIVRIVNRTNGRVIFSGGICR